MNCTLLKYAIAVPVIVPIYIAKLCEAFIEVSNQYTMPEARKKLYLTFFSVKVCMGNPAKFSNEKWLSD